MSSITVCLWNFVFYECFLLCNVNRNLVNGKHSRISVYSESRRHKANVECNSRNSLEFLWIENFSNPTVSRWRIPLSYFNIRYQTASAFIKSRDALSHTLEWMLGGARKEIRNCCRCYCTYSINCYTCFKCTNFSLSQMSFSY